MERVQEKISITQDKVDMCIIVDIDGTLAHMQGRGAFDWERVGEDTVDIAVRSVVNSAYRAVTRVFVFSGRDSACRDITEKWLEDNEVNYDILVMREQGDIRKDTIVKLEMFDEYIRGKYNVLFVLDDRPSVCRMWRSLGLKVLQVGNPYIEF